MRLQKHLKMLHECSFVQEELMPSVVSSHQVTTRLLPLASSLTPLSTAPPLQELLPSHSMGCEHSLNCLGRELNMELP